MKYNKVKMDNCNNNYANYFIDVLKYLCRTLMAFEVDVNNNR